MTDYTATPEQWADAEYYGNPERQPRPISEYACILELRARIEALEVVRPKPPSLKQEALLAVDTAVADGRLSPHVSNLVRRALETLDEMSDCMRAGFIPKRSDLDTIRRALEQPAAAPVPVSERLPGPSDCAPWPKDSDASAWCWLGREVDGGWGWEQRSAGYLVAFPGDFTHWLPAHALPVPTVEEVM